MDHNNAQSTKSKNLDFWRWTFFHFDNDTDFVQLWKEYHSGTKEGTEQSSCTSS